MNEFDTTPHPDYTKGFNEGYLIAKHMPELSDALDHALSKSDRSKGFLDGKQQFVLEKEKTRYPDFLKSDRLANLDKSDKSKDKDKDEPERDR